MDLLKEQPYTSSLKCNPLGNTTCRIHPRLTGTGGMFHGGLLHHRTLGEARMRQRGDYTPPSRSGNRAEGQKLLGNGHRSWSHLPKVSGLFHSHRLHLRLSCVFSTPGTSLLHTLRISSTFAGFDFSIGFPSVGFAQRLRLIIYPKAGTGTFSKKSILVRIEDAMVFLHVASSTQLLKEL